MCRLMGCLAQLFRGKQLVRHGGRLHAKRLVHDLCADAGRFKQRPIAGVRLDESTADAALDPRGKEQTLHDGHVAGQQFDPGGSD